VTPSPQRLPYSAALDGLRAVAVIAVVCYHLDITWMRGGFLGVDLFFVISGFLITRLLLGEHEDTGRIALGDFWIRRFRRLVPPLIIVVATSVVATRLWGIPQQWDSMRGDAVASLGYVANWRFILNDVSYFETLLGPSPLRHIWSLAVEEQWYVIWPLVMAALAPFAARQHRFGTTSAGLIVAASMSALWMAVLYDPSDLSRVYYGTDTRAQQLLVGAALGWLTVAAPARFTAASLHRYRGAFTLILLGFVAATVVVNDEAPWLYRGGLLALSIGAAALVAAASLPDSDGPLGWLAARPLVAIGRRSYSLYLWHWPVIVFVGPPMGLELPTVPLAVLQIGVSVVLTEVTYRWIETPTRHSRQRPAGTLAVWTAAALATVAIASTTLVTNLTALPDIEVLRPSFVPAPPPASTTSPAPLPTTVVRAGDAPPTTDEVDIDPTPTSTIPPAPAPAPRLMLVGDSTAAVLALARPTGFPAGWEATKYARFGCGITDGVPIDVDADDPIQLYNTSGCAEWFDDWSELSQQFQPSISVVMIGAWELFDHLIDGRRISFPSDEWKSHVDAAIRRGVEAASSGGERVVLLRLPCMDQPAAALLDAQARSDRERVEAFNAVLEAVADDLETVSTLPLDDLLCPGGEPIGEVDGSVIRYDGVHLTEAGTTLVWSWLEAQLEALLLSAI
jgi:peptidoglycan/LPS O-acetylase OafA/YrhL